MLILDFTLLISCEIWDLSLTRKGSPLQVMTLPLSLLYVSLQSQKDQSKIFFVSYVSSVGAQNSSSADWLYLEYT